MSILDQFFVYHPDPWKDRDWARLIGLPLEDVWFQAGDGARLFGWYVEAQADRPVILWCHGNAGNIINRLENLRELYRLGLSVFLFDYRNIRGSGMTIDLLEPRGKYRSPFPSHGKDLISLVYLLLVCLVQRMRETRETRQPPAPDRRLLNRPFFPTIVDRIDSDSYHSPCRLAFPNLKA